MWTPVARAQAPDGGELVLYERAGDYMIRVNGWELMTSCAHCSEEQMVELALGRRRAECSATRSSARVLVGGLGLGYTLGAVLRRLSPASEVLVAELVPAVIEWNHRWVGHLAGHPLRDPRVAVHCGDVAELIAAAQARWDVILLDIDNGPWALSQPSNAWLYQPAGLARCSAALRPGGALALWSAARAEDFAQQLAQAGFSVEEVDLPVGPAGRVLHTIYLAQRVDD